MGLTVDSSWVAVNYSWPWPWRWIGSCGILSCIIHWPLCTYQISLKSDKLFVDGHTNIPTDGRTFPPLTLLGRLGGVDLIKATVVSLYISTGTASKGPQMWHVHNTTFSAFEVSYKNAPHKSTVIITTILSRNTKSERRLSTMKVESTSDVNVNVSENPSDFGCAKKLPESDNIQI